MSEEHICKYCGSTKSIVKTTKQPVIEHRHEYNISKRIFIIALVVIIGLTSMFAIIFMPIPDNIEKSSENYTYKDYYDYDDYNHYYNDFYVEVIYHYYSISTTNITYQFNFTKNDIIYGFFSNVEYTTNDAKINLFITNGTHIFLSVLNSYTGTFNLVINATNIYDLIIDPIESGLLQMCIYAMYRY
jgi:hypothetical protein